MRLVWRAEALEHLERLAARSGTGVCHTERESDGNGLARNGVPAACDFDRMHQGTGFFNGWVNALLMTPAWVNAPWYPPNVL